MPNRVITSIFRRLIIGVSLASLPLLAGTGCATGKTPHVPTDLSTPKSAALTFLHAISAGDIKTAKSVSIGNDDQKAAVEAMSSLITGLRAFDTAIATHFGVEAIQADTQLKQALADLSGTPIQHIENAIVNESPLKASVEPAIGGIRLKAHPPIYLVKDKNQWKIDLPATAQLDNHFSPEVAARFLAAGQALHEAARKVNGGKYKSLAEAQKDADGTLP